jgi:hypothetical protein
MRVKLQLVLCSDDGREDTVTDVITLQKDHRRREHLGLTLAEAKQLLTTIQHRVLQRQVTTFLDACSACPDCGTPFKGKGYHTRSFRTLFGTFKLARPWLFHGRCRRRKTTSFRPLSSRLTESVAPELRFMETKWASLVSYGMTVAALTDFLPLRVTLDVKTVRHDTLKGAERCEAELGEERGSCSEGCPRAWGNLPIPHGPITVGIDGGSVRDGEAKQHNFEVIVGKRTLAVTRDDEDEPPSSKRLGFMQTLDATPKRRLFEGLPSQGMQRHQPITFLSDGSDTVRDLQLYLSPEAEHILDWFHLLYGYPEFHTYIERNRAFIPNYGERYRYGERISTGFVESTVNQVVSKRFCKKQQMQWTRRGAHLLLQTRVKTLNQ